jgi:hypothetical protein
MAEESGVPDWGEILTPWADRVPAIRKKKGKE